MAGNMPDLRTDPHLFVVNWPGGRQAPGNRPPGSAADRRRRRRRSGLTRDASPGQWPALYRKPSSSTASPPRPERSTGGQEACWSELPPKELHPSRKPARNSRIPPRQRSPSPGNPRSPCSLPASADPGSSSLRREWRNRPAQPGPRGPWNRARRPAGNAAPGALAAKPATLAAGRVVERPARVVISVRPVVVNGGADPVTLGVGLRRVLGVEVGPGPVVIEPRPEPSRMSSGGRSPSRS